MTLLQIGGRAYFFSTPTRISRAQPDCEGYFKIEFGTGLEGQGLPCHCPYCGHVAGHDHFWTKEQIEYARSMASRRIADAIRKDFKKLELEHKPKGSFGIGVSLKFRPGRRPRIHHYREKKLETEVICSNCTLRYAVYGVFAVCPDCGQHNSLQILDKSLEVVDKMVEMATTVERVLAEKLLENALEDCVSTFDGFGRELCRVYGSAARNRARAERISFQNLEGARDGLLDLFRVDLSAGVDPEEWRATVVAFQQRHLVAHRFGVVDQEYIDKTGDACAVVGRKVIISGAAVKALVDTIKALAHGMVMKFRELKGIP